MSQFLYLESKMLQTKTKKSNHPSDIANKWWVGSFYWVGRSPWVAIDVLGVIEADSQYVEGTGENFQWEVEQTDSQAFGATKTATSDKWLKKKKIKIITWSWVCLNLWHFVCRLTFKPLNITYYVHFLTLFHTCPLSVQVQALQWYDHLCDCKSTPDERCCQISPYY